MKPVTYDLDLYRGDTFAFRVTLWDDKDKTIPFDLTGASVEAEWRDKPGGAVIVNLQTTVTLPNIVDIEVTEDTWDTAPRGGAWDLEVAWPGRVLTMVRGDVKVTVDVTNSTEQVMSSGRFRRAS